MAVYYAPKLAFCGSFLFFSSYIFFSCSFCDFSLSWRQDGVTDMFKAERTLYCRRSEACIHQLSLKGEISLIKDERIAFVTAIVDKQ